MKSRVRLACKPNIINIPLEKILPLRKVTQAIKSTVKYKCIAASIREIGIIEPLIVFPHQQEPGRYMLLDGHIRLDILLSMDVATVDCLVSTDDESYTYNHKVNRLSAIQEHFMILKVIKNGVSEEEIALALNVNVANIRKKRDLLVGICPEAVLILKGKRSSALSLRELRRVTPMRQIEMAELMSASHNYSSAYAKGLVAMTPEDQLVNGESSKDVDGISPEEMARMEREMDSLSQDFGKIEKSYGKNVLNLVIVIGYLKKVLDNSKAVRFLAQYYPELLAQFQKIVDSRNLVELPEES